MAYDARGYFIADYIILNKQSYLNGLVTSTTTTTTFAATTTTIAPTTTTTSGPTTTTTVAPTTSTTTSGGTTTTVAPTTSTTTSGGTTTTTTSGPTTTTTTGTTTATPINLVATTIATATCDSTLRPYSQGVYDRYSDKSFFCFMQMTGASTDTYVTECDHSGGLHTWGTPELVYTQSNSQKYNYPTISMLPDRRIVLSYASPFDDELGFAISDNPADNTSWTTSIISTVSPGTIEYPRIVVDRKGYIYLFYNSYDTNGASHKRWHRYVKSEDSGTTWSTQNMVIERPLDDTYGMCEVYVGYSVLEPYRNGEPEKWWFTWTASSGFEYRGEHVGPNDSANLICDNSERFASGSWSSWPDSSIDGSGFTYRWLYNRTKGTNSGMDSATSGTVVPSDSMDWDIGDEYGIAYHNVHHSDLYTAYFRPDTEHWYDAADNDLGVTISTDEMETNTCRAYTSPSPPHGRDTGFVPQMSINDSGEPLIIQRGGYWRWNGSSWDLLIPDIAIEFNGTHTGSNDEATVLTDATASFSTDQLVGEFIYNVTDNSWGRVTSNTATTITCSDGFEGGTEDAWDTGDVWNIMGGEDLRYIWFADGYYYWAMNSLEVARSADAITWTTVDTATLPDRHSYSSYAVFSAEPHAEAAINQHEYTTNNNGTAWGISYGETQVAASIILKSDAPVVGTSTTTNVRAYVCDSVYGAKSRVRNATNAITLTVISGNATVDSSPISATDGMAVFTINSHSTTDETVLEATGSGLDSYRIHIYTDTSL